MRYCSVASGSSGNCHFIEAGGVRVLVDAGLSLKALESNLISRGIPPQSIQALFVTHEHSDHVKSVGAWARRYQIPVFATEGTWYGMERCLGKMRPEKCYSIRSGQGYRMDGLRVEPFLIYHDANEPVGYSFTAGEEKLVVMTDTGMVSSEMRDMLPGARIAVVVCNHDIDMLMGGSYPLSLKRRIRSNLGHLSNEDCGHLLAELIPDNPDCDYLLAHLSQENNTPETALETVREILQRRLGEGDYRLHMTRRDLPTQVFETQEEPCTGTSIRI